MSVFLRILIIILVLVEWGRKIWQFPISFFLGKHVVRVSGAKVSFCIFPFYVSYYGALDSTTSCVPCRSLFQECDSVVTTRAPKLLLGTWKSRSVSASSSQREIDCWVWSRILWYYWLFILWNQQGCSCYSLHYFILFIIGHISVLINDSSHVLYVLYFAFFLQFTYLFTNFYKSL
jgi:hypothetical protein